MMMPDPLFPASAPNDAELASICHAHNIPLLVDEAHGAHFGLHPELPTSALRAGADAAVQSTHKTLSSMTQSAMLHIRGPRVAHQRVSRALQTLQSSSPSYILMSSLDAARQLAASPGFLGDALAAAAAARAGLQALAGVQVLHGSTAAASESISGFDPLRIVVNTSVLGLTGFDAAALLEEQHGGCITILWLLAIMHEWSLNCLCCGRGVWDPRAMQLVLLI
jgi:arginine decarboxylase